MIQLTTVNEVFTNDTIQLKRNETKNREVCAHRIPITGYQLQKVISWSQKQGDKG